MCYYINSRYLPGQFVSAGSEDYGSVKGGKSVETYSVKEVADMLSVNPETVRRWIRSGKLETTKGPVHNEKLIIVSSLNSFLSKTKYNSLTDGLLVNATLTLALLGGTVAEKILKNKELLNSKIPSAEIKKWAEQEVEKLDRSIDSKQKKIDKIQKEIDGEARQRDSLRAVMKSLSLVPDDPAQSPKGE